MGLLLESLAIHEQCLGAHDLEVADACVSLARLYKARGQLAAAEIQSRRALDILGDHAASDGGTHAARDNEKLALRFQMHVRKHELATLWVAQDRCLADAEKYLEVRS